jgi:hypothetical protein
LWCSDINYEVILDRERRLAEAHVWGAEERISLWEKYNEKGSISIIITSLSREIDLALRQTC